jgi:two-component system, chemotaxis family, protein-glutamate methylesterase/glutaminase
MTTRSSTSADGRAGKKPLRVVIVDDSAFMRGAIAKTLSIAGGFEVVGQGRDGEEAVRRVVELQPDVVTMDYNMPKKNGAEAVREIMQQRPTPVIMFSAHTRQGARETFEALGAGAVDFITKPGGEVSIDLSKVADELVRKLTAAAGARPRATTAVSATRPARPPGPTTLPPGGPRLCIIGISTGGPAALSRLIPSLPGNTRFAVVVVQHMPAGFTAALAERLDGMSALPVSEATDGEQPRPGTVLIAPGDRHVEFDEAGLVRLTDGPLVNGCRPAADVTMVSAARVYGRRCIGVVMTGMGKDGVAGLTAIKRADGKTLAQDQETSVIFGMPRAAIEAGVVDDVAPLDEIAGRLRYL